MNGMCKYVTALSAIVQSRILETPALLADGICAGLGTDGGAHGGLSLWNEMEDLPFCNECKTWCCPE